jgi:hypothetical protein
MGRLAQSRVFEVPPVQLILGLKAPPRRIDLCAGGPASLAPVSSSRVGVCNSFDHLVGAEQQGLWNCETERLGGLEIDNELELGRLPHRQVSGLGAVESRDRWLARVRWLLNAKSARLDFL